MTAEPAKPAPGIRERAKYLAQAMDHMIEVSVGACFCLAFLACGLWIVGFAAAILIRAFRWSLQ